jgi:outer membrane protein TolC
MAPERFDRPWTPATTSDGEIIAGAKPASGVGNGYVLPSNAALANAALASVPPASGVDAGKVYSLPELIDLAETTNPSTRIAWNDARRVALAAGIAESAYLPKLTASAVGAYQVSHGQTSTLGVSVSGENSASGTISVLSLQWLLFDFGERAKQASVIANIGLTAVHQQVIYGVTMAFYAHAAAVARAATATQSLRNARAVQAAAEDRSRHGFGTVIEVAQARQATAQGNLAVVQATGGVQDAYLGVISAMGISPMAKIRIADVSGRKLSPAMEAPVERIVSESLARRPDMLSAYAAQKASLSSVHAAQAEFMPKLFLSATGAYNSGSLGVTALPSIGQQESTVNINGSRIGGSILAGVTLPLYDGGTRAAALAQARAEADSAGARLMRVRDDAVRQIVFAVNTLHTSLSAYQASDALSAAAQTTFDAALAAYRSGMGSITDLTLA